jgi:hypothetical protein
MFSLRFLRRKFLLRLLLVVVMLKFQDLARLFLLCLQWAVQMLS